MEENKYYTPEIEELYIGFECEFFNHMQGKEWEKEVCDADTLSIALDTWEHGTVKWGDDFSQTFRVKYLDKEDLIELGFKPVKGVEVNMCNKQIYYKDQWCSVVFNYDRITDIVIQKNSFPVFNGVVKNKSELIKVLKMLGIK